MSSYFINFLNLKLHKLKRMVYLPRKWLVLDVGSGDGPFPRADVLCDKYMEDTQRVSKLVIDRPFVIGDITALPFLDNAFDFVFCSHVLEHVDKPEIALQELTRIGKRGYIEVPTEFQEKMQSTISHKWLVKKEENMLVFWEKDRTIFDECIQSKIRTLIYKKDKTFLSFFYKHYNLFNTEYYWEQGVKFKVLRKNSASMNDKETREVSLQEVIKQIDHASLPVVFNLRNLLKFIIKTVFTGGKKIDLLKIIACPNCKREVRLTGKDIVCSFCNNKFSFHKNIPIMLKEYII